MFKLVYKDRNNSRVNKLAKPRFLPCRPSGPVTERERGREWAKIKLIGRATTRARGLHG